MERERARLEERLCKLKVEQECTDASVAMVHEEKESTVEQKAFLEQRIDTLRTEIQNTESEHPDIVGRKKQLDQLNEALAELERRIEERQGQVAEMDQRRSRVKAKAVGKERAASPLRKRLGELEKELTQASLLHYASLKTAETYFKTQDQRYDVGTPWGLASETVGQIEVCNIETEVHQALSSLLSAKEAELLEPVKRSITVLRASIEAKADEV